MAPVTHEWSGVGVMALSSANPARSIAEAAGAPSIPSGPLVTAWHASLTSTASTVSQPLDLTLPVCTEGWKYLETGVPPLGGQLLTSG